MTGNQARLVWLLLFSFTALFVACGLPVSQAQPEPVREHVAPETALGKGTFLYFHYDGAKRHRESWEQTAAYDAVVKSGVKAMFDKLVKFVDEEFGGATDSRIEALATAFAEEGFTVGISLPSEIGLPIPSVTIIVRDAGESAEVLKSGLIGLTGGAMDISDEQMSGRTVHRTLIPQTPGVELSFWAEKADLMISAGIDSTRQTLAVLDGESPNLTENQIWQAVQDDPAGDGVDIESAFWFDFALLRDRFGSLPLPLPSAEPLTIDSLLQATGLSGLNNIVARGGYHGRSLWSDLVVNTTDETSGLLDLMNQRTIGWDDLPPLPVNVTSFHAGTFDSGRAYDTLLAMVRRMAAMQSVQAQQLVDQVLEMARDRLGFDLKTDLLDSLGDVCVIYGDPDQGYLGTGGAAVVQLKDREKAQRTIGTLLEHVAEFSRGDFKIHESSEPNAGIWTFELGKRAELGAIAFEGDWMVVSLLPQAVTAFRMRQSGELPRWSPETLAKPTGRKLPQQFTSVSVNDPRPSYHALAKLAPLAITAGVGILKEEQIIPEDMRFPITLADMPPAERIAQPLYPNVSFSTQKAGQVRWTTDRSMPGIPLISGIGEGNSVMTTGVLVALLLPAVQQARTAARRAQSTNNLKQLALAMHNYHDVYGAFPQGTAPNEKLEVEERFSWLALILPFLEQQSLYDRLDRDLAWNDDDNQRFVETQIPTFLNPQGDMNPQVAETHYVGIAGVGKDAAQLPVTSPRAGVFGYNRKTRLRDILDGTSNTVMISEGSGDHGPWAQGGRSTIRSLTAEPGINGPDGIGGPYPGGCNMGFADGSVRFISENIDPAILKALFTIRGGENIGGF